ncbi:MAG: YncE family protein [Candidatus Baltobacteraceae bacterium]
MPDRSALLALIVLALPAAGGPSRPQLVPVALAAPRGPLLPGSRFPLLRSPAAGLHFVLLGPGSLDGATYVAPPQLTETAAAFVLAAGPASIGSVQIALAPAPTDPASLLAVASYDDGIAVHRRSDGKLLGIFATEGGVADVARSGDVIFAPSTDSNVLWRLDLRTARLSQSPGATTANEIALAGPNAFVTQRDVGGLGALARIDVDQPVVRTVTGTTAEGLALDIPRNRAYVSNVNDASVVAVELNSLRVVRRYAVPERPFGIALDAKRGVLYVVSNQAARPGVSGGRVVALNLGDGRILARSKPLVFPLGVAYDPKSARAFVTDEATGRVAILDGRTLATVSPALKACSIPWRPALDVVHRRLYVPCAGSNALAAFDLNRLRPLAGSPYATGGYPLGAAP